MYKQYVLMILKSYKVSICIETACILLQYSCIFSILLFLAGGKKSREEQNRMCLSSKLPLISLHNNIELMKDTGKKHIRHFFVPVEAALASVDPLNTLPPGIFQPNTHTDESSTCLSGVVRGRERLSHRPLLT